RRPARRPGGTRLRLRGAHPRGAARGGVAALPRGVPRARRRRARAGLRPAARGGAVRRRAVRGRLPELRGGGAPRPGARARARGASCQEVAVSGAALAGAADGLRVVARARVAFDLAELALQGPHHLGAVGRGAHEAVLVRLRGGEGGDGVALAAVEDLFADAEPRHALRLPRRWAR